MIFVICQKVYINTIVKSIYATYNYVFRCQQVVLNPGPLDQKVQLSTTGGFEPRSPRPKVWCSATQPPRPIDQIE